MYCSHLIFIRTVVYTTLDQDMGPGWTNAIIRVSNLNLPLDIGYISAQKAKHPNALDAEYMLYHCCLLPRSCKHD